MTAISTQDISRVSVLVTLSISSWDTHRQDKRASLEVATSNKVTDKRLCRLRKTLIPRDPVLKELESVIRAARTFHYDNTHTWMHDGPRILTRKNFDEYMTRMREFKVRFEAAALNFIASYDDLKEQAKQALGGLYAESDYPSRDSLYREYKFDTVVQPLPLASSLLDLGLDSSEGEALRLRLEKELADTFAKANRRVFDDFGVKLKKLTEKLVDPAGYVMAETLEAVRNLAELLPRINLLGDTALDTLAKDVVASLKGVTADSLKTNPSVRERVTDAMLSASRRLAALSSAPSPMLREATL